MAKTAVLVGIISMIMMQSVSSAPKVNYNQDHVENETEGGIEQIESATLKLKGYGIDLEDLDGWTAGQSDPYMEVTATDFREHSETKKTPTRGGTNNPRWDDYLVFSKRQWKWIRIKVFDDDGAGREPDELCPTAYYNIYNNFEGTEEFSFNCYKGHVTIIFELET